MTRSISHDQLGVAERPRRRRPGLARRSRCSGRSARRAAQDLADRLDPEPAAFDDAVAVLVDDYGRTITSVWRSSSAAAKKADAVFKISFARRSSRFSRSSSAIRCASSVVVPGRLPSSTSACRTQTRNVSGMHAELVSDPLDRSARRRVLPCVDRHPGRPLTQLVAVLPWCSHNSHPSWIESLHSNPGRFTICPFSPRAAQDSVPLTRASPRRT